MTSSLNNSKHSCQRSVEQVSLKNEIFVLMWKMKIAVLFGSTWFLLFPKQEKKKNQRKMGYFLGQICEALLVITSPLSSCRPLLSQIWNIWSYYVLCELLISAYNIIPLWPEYKRWWKSEPYIYGSTTVLFPCTFALWVMYFYFFGHYWCK